MELTVDAATPHIYGVRARVHVTSTSYEYIYIYIHCVPITIDQHREMIAEKNILHFPINYFSLFISPLRA